RESDRRRRQSRRPRRERQFGRRASDSSAPKLRRRRTPAARLEHLGSCLLLIRIAAPMRILVTGAAGYIGSALVRALDGEVLATDQTSMPFANAISGNIAYPQFARSLITAEVGVVFHL